jgi:Peptidase family S41/N-terminal domain of Peptidase_S41 in eukaryotic IRBP
MAMSFPSARKRLLSWMLIAASRFFVVPFVVSTFAQVSVPDSPAGRTLQAFLQAFNSADRSQIEAYVKTYGSQQTVDGLLAFRAQTGGFTLLSIEQSTPDAISFRIKGKEDATEAFGTLLLASPAPPKVKSLSIRALPPGAVVDNITLDAAERQRVIQGVISNLKEYYVYPEIAQKMSDALEAHQRQGDYNAITDGSTFATRLVEDLRAVSHDKHLRVDYSPFKLPPEPHGPDPALEARMQKEMEHMNCGFEKVEILSRNIGYLKFNMFANPDICGPTVVAAMGFLAHVDAIIFDLRENGGGDPRMVAFLASYLIDRPTHLSDIYNRKEDTTTQYWTLPYVPGKRLAGTPAFVLTSGNTFSGAEDFTYNLQALKRVTVVGETTGGGAHPVAGHRIDDHFMVGLPFARSLNLLTKTNWEGTGVTPDVAVKSAEALETAERLAASELQTREPKSQ